MTRPSFLDQKNEVASIRSNNPGAIWDAPFTRKRGAIGGQKLNDGLGQGNSIAYFDDAIDGARCLFQLLDVGYTKRSVRSAITKWSGGNHVASYLSILKSQANLSPDEQITKDKLRNPAWAVPFAKAMAWHEAGKTYPLDDGDWNLAHSEAFDLVDESPAPVVVAKKVTKAPVSAPVAAGGIVALISGYIEPALQWLQATAVQLTTLAPVKSMFVQAGANAQAFTIGGIVLVGFVAAKKMMQEDEE